MTITTHGSPRHSSTSSLSKASSQTEIAGNDSSCIESDDPFRGIREEINQKSNPQVATVKSIFQTCADHLIHVAIVLNAITMGLAQEYKDHELLWDTSEHIFTAIFFLEMIAKLHAHRTDYFRDNWNLLDFILAWLGVIDRWILEDAETNMSSFSAVRVIRLMRILRMMRMFHFNKDIRILSEGLYHALKAQASVGIFLLSMIYTFALFFTSTIKGIDDNPETQIFFGTLPAAMLTLFNISIVDEWSDVIRLIARDQPELIVVFIAYLVVVFGMMNLVVSLIVERSLEVNRKYETEVDHQRKREKLKQMVRLADQVYCDSGGVPLTSDEFEGAIRSNSALMDRVQHMHLPHGLGIADLHLMLDHDMDGSVSKDEFIDGVCRLIFDDDFQLGCCIMLAISEVKQQLHASIKSIVQEVEGALRNGESITSSWHHLGPRLHAPATSACSAQPLFSPRSKPAESDADDASTDAITRHFQELRRQIDEIVHRTEKLAQADLEAICVENEASSKDAASRPQEVLVQAYVGDGKGTIDANGVSCTTLNSSRSAPMRDLSIQTRHSSRDDSLHSLYCIHL